MSAISELRIDMADAERIIKRLTNHWRHKLTIEQQGHEAVIYFSDEVLTILGAYSDHLVAKIEAKNHEQLSQYEKVVLDHLNRMAQQEYAANWIRLES